MKIAIISDLHLNKSIYRSVMDKEWSIPFRNADFMRSFEWMVKDCVNNVKPDLLVIGGDVCDTPNPSNIIRGFFSAQLSKLLEADIPVVILVGNHDVLQQSHALDALKKLNLKKIKVIDKPMKHNFEGHELLFFPYSLDVERKLILIKDQFTQFIDKLPEKEEGVPRLLFAHFGVKGGRLNSYSDSETPPNIDVDSNSSTSSEEKEKKAFINRKATDISVDDLDKVGAEYVILGDFHEHQILNTKKCVAMYTGSIERTSMTEADQKKGFVVYDSEAEEKGSMGKCRFVEYPKCRPMIEIRGTLSAMKEEFGKIDKEAFKGAVVKLSFTGDSDELLSFSTGSEQFKKEIVEAIEPIHLFHKQTVKNEEEEEEVSELEKEILEKGHMEDTDVLDVVEEMIKERLIDEAEEQELTIKLAQEIYQVNKEGK